jgi:F-type H+-transporting ATPase subunit b
MEVSPTTVIFEIINFLVLVWLLRKILYQPLQRALRERQSALESEREEAESARESAEALRAEAEAERAEAGELRQRLHTQMRAEVESERRTLLERAREEAAAKRAHEEARLEEERARLHREVEALAIEQSATLAGRLLDRVGAESLHEALLNEVLQTVDRGTDGQGLRLPSGAPAEAQVASARPLDGPTLERIRRQLAKVVGAPVALAQREQSSLIAGAVLRVGDQVIDGSARTLLEAFQRRAHEHLAAEGGR